MGRLMVALDQLRHALTPGTSEQAADRIALLRAATDWQRAQVSARLTAKALQRLWKAYRRQISNLPKRTRLPTDAFTRAIASGHPDAAPDAQRRLTALQRWQTEQRPAVWAARYDRRPLDD
ncbi:hypothetical protein [Planobispora longispora]|uniref:Uncharacterized protein n=1 Tax=Planobispora longispora TaxID=28887 RepID=A0A8J3RNP1_9ACTN|nr:hypothetical protein [Planobispora longispora]GIH78299.1 hypothetical protein Plo01_47280 [Planobispora longispora]